MMKLTSRFATSLAVLAVACALAASYAQPAVAQTAKRLKCTGCVKSKQIGNGQVRKADLGAGAVTSAKIQSNAVTTDKIQSNAVTAAKIANGAVDLGKLSPAVQAQLNASGTGDITGVTAGDGLSGGGATGDVTIDVNFAGSGTANTAARSNHTHNSATIENGSITADDLAPASVGVSELANNAVTSAKIADGAVGTADLATNAVTSGNIADGAVGTADLATNAVTSAKIADGAVGTADLATDAVTSAKIANGAVGTVDLATDAVTSAKIVDGAVALDKLSPAVQAQLGAAGTGDITGVTAGSGLNGGGDTGDVTLNLDDNIVLGTATDDGDLSVEDTTGTATVILDGDTGTVTNSLTGDGVVKAWARISADGTVASCYRCNMDPLETQILATGLYEVDFTPLSTDIRGRPRSVTGDGQIAGVFGRASISDRIATVGPPAEPLDASSVFVATRDFDDAVAVDRAFTIVIY